MADEADSKSVVGNHVWVQVPLPAFILVPVNDCRRQEFTGTAYTAAKVFETAVNFGREYKTQRSHVRMIT